MNNKKIKKIIKNDFKNEIDYNSIKEQIKRNFVFNKNEKLLIHKRYVIANYLTTAIMIVFVVLAQIYIYTIKIAIIFYCLAVLTIPFLIYFSCKIKKLNQDK